jgi:glyoxylase-like metal-dependent hydrolase (beta-lactamase superfamily II)
MTRPTPRWTVAALVAAGVLLVPAALMAQGGPDFSKVQVKTTKIAGSVYTLEGQGGVIGVLAGPDGAFVVDSQFAPLTDRIVAAIKQLTPGPIRFLVNTHVHGDHTGGNENFGRLGVTLLSRDQLRDRLAGGAKPSPAPALPVLTYNAPVTIHMNGETVQLIPVPRAHTDGDTMVHFTTADVIMTGDFYRSVGYPFPDLNSGGTFDGLIAGLNAVVAIARPSTRIVPGHGPIVDEKAVEAHRDMALAVRDKVAALVKQGMTADQVVAAKPTAGTDATVDSGGSSSERFLRALHRELSAAP